MFNAYRHCWWNMNFVFVPTCRFNFNVVFLLAKVHWMALSPDISLKVYQILVECG
jgi:hypothetical protein